MPETFLADDLSKLAGSLVLSHEHRQIKRLLDESKRFRLLPSAVAAVDRVVDRAPWTIEHNLDLAAHPADRPIWIEFGDAPRRREGLAFAGHDVDLVGYLLAPSPADPNATVAVVAWRLASGTVHHAFSVVHWHRLDLATHAAHARHRYSRIRIEAMARMMSLFQVSTPQGLKEIVLEAHLGDDVRMRQVALMESRLAASGEMLFAFGALVLLADRIDAEPGEDGYISVEAAPLPRAPLMDLVRRITGRPMPSFRRRRRGVPTVSLVG
ncbi:hypothetical protein [Methylorubrum populi]|uniref:Uncharacterized protein n=1 Tax=Methylorubrum populi TaxID=223967 RepID=A0A833J1Q6_9HYPH|nr:hypothetical protein [Methylorubrum populi]KAB7781831.1 hypothetical protein F8B43_5725 [Methylorubrum populi]